MQRPIASEHTDIEPPAPGDGRIVGIHERQLEQPWRDPIDCLGCDGHLDVSDPHLRVVLRVDAAVAGTPGPWYPEIYLHDGACLGQWVSAARPAGPR